MMARPRPVSANPDASCSTGMPGAWWTAPSFLEGVTSGKVGTHDFTESASR